MYISEYTRGERAIWKENRGGGRKLFWKILDERNDGKIEKYIKKNKKTRRLAMEYEDVQNTTWRE